MENRDIFNMFNEFFEEMENRFDPQIPKDEPVFTIEVVSNLTGIPYWQIRNILKEDLIQPVVVGKKKQLFSKNDLKRLECINYLMCERGVNLQGVKVFFEIAYPEE